jgi:class 3 adenylate cyclase
MTTSETAGAAPSPREAGDLDYDQLGLTEMIQIQNEISKALARRFQRDLALVFTDVVGSTAYFQRFGDEEGRRLLQRHLDLLRGVLPKFGGRVVDTAGDGAFSCFPKAAATAMAMLELQRLIAHDNTHFGRDQELAVRCGIHWGSVLTDGVVVTGDAVNVCARVAGLGRGAEIRITRAAFHELPGAARAMCRPLPPEQPKGVREPIETLHLEWRDLRRVPTRVRLVETGETIAIPDLGLVSFGRLRDKHGQPANDIVLRLPDEEATQKIGRWHFELRRLAEGCALRQVSAGSTEVNGQPVAEGSLVSITAGAVVRVGGVLTLEFTNDAPKRRVGESGETRV